jgi:hypothetical protein
MKLVGRCSIFVTTAMIRHSPHMVPLLSGDPGLQVHPHPRHELLARGTCG